jgi:hypothetical protein
MNGLLVVTAALASSPPLAPAPYGYAAARVDVPSSASPEDVFAVWEQITKERQLTVAEIDVRGGLALGAWQVRLHVCTGQVRYHVVLGAQGSLQLFVVAECYGTAVGLPKAARGLAVEVARALGKGAMVQDAPLSSVPARLWEERSRRGKNVPQEQAPGGTRGE